MLYTILKVSIKFLTISANKPLSGNPKLMKQGGCIDFFNSHKITT